MDIPAIRLSGSLQKQKRRRLILLFPRKAAKSAKDAFPSLREDEAFVPGVNRTTRFDQSG